MVVMMRVAQSWQHAGLERQLAVGASYDLPDAVADDLIASGCAVLAETREVAAFAGAPENKLTRRDRR